MLGGGRVVVSLSVRMCEVWEVWLGLWPPCPLKKPYSLFLCNTCPERMLTPTHLRMRTGVCMCS